MQLLVVEDEPDLARTLRKALAEEEFAVDVAGNGEDAIHPPPRWRDAIILDLMLPGTDVWTALGNVEARSQSHGSRGSAATRLAPATGDRASHAITARSI